MFKQKLIIATILFIIAIHQSRAQTGNKSPLQLLSSCVGDWSVEITMWMESSESMISKASVHSEMIMSGLFLTSHFTGELMNSPYEGIYTIGYNIPKKVFVATWIDNQNSGIDYLEGKLSDDGKSIEFRGVTFDPLQQKNIPIRHILTLTDDKHQKLEMYSEMSGMGMEMKMMEYDLNRQ